MDYDISHTDIFIIDDTIHMLIHYLISLPKAMTVKCSQGKIIQTQEWKILLMLLSTIKPWLIELSLPECLGMMWHLVL